MPKKLKSRFLVKKPKTRPSYPYKTTIEQHMVEHSRTLEDSIVQAMAYYYGIPYPEKGNEDE